MAFQLNVTTRKTKQREVQKRNSLVLQLTLKGWSTADIGKHPEINYAVHNGQCQRVIQIQNELVAQNKLEKNGQGSLVIPVQKVTEHKWAKIENEIAKSDVQAFKTLIEYMREHGRSDGQIGSFTSALTNVCNTVNIHPNEIINAQTIEGDPDYLNKTRQTLKQFLEIYRAGNASIGKAGRVRNIKDATGDRYKMALRLLLLAHGKAIPKLPINDLLSGTKGANFGAYNGIGLSDKQTDDAINFVEKNGKDILGKAWDFGYVGFIALMPEIIVRTEALALWTVNYETEYDEYEKQQVEYDFIGGFFEPKTKKSRPQGWDKFIIDPLARIKLRQMGEYRKGKTLVPFNESKQFGANRVTDNVNKLMKEFYIDQGILPAETRMKMKDRPDSCRYKTGTSQGFYDQSGAYVLRHTSAHRWCRRTKYDYGFVSEMGWTDMNTLRQCYAGMDIKHRLKANDCFYCNPPMNPEKMNNKLFCSATHAFIYFSNGMKARGQNQ